MVNEKIVIDVSTNLNNVDDVERLKALLDEVQEDVSNIASTEVTVKTNNEPIKETGDEFDKAKQKGTSFTSKVKGGLDKLTGGFGSLVSAIGMTSIAMSAWSGATERQTNKMLLARKYGVQSANDISDAIKEAVTTTPGDDTFLTSMLSNASLKAKMTKEELQGMASAIADYNVLSQASGSSTFETQGEIRNYLMTGETGRMKDTALAPYLKQLEEADTVTERVKMLNSALKELGYDGASGMKTASNVMEEFKGKMQSATADLGEQLLPVIQGAIDGFNALDDWSGGNLSKAIMGIVTVGTSISPMVSTFNQLKWAYDSCKGAVEGLTIAQMKEKIQSIAGTAVHYAKMPLFMAETVATQGLTMATWEAIVAEYGFLAPILLIIGAVALLIGGIYLLGQYMGWWNDWGGFIDAVKARIMQIWNALVKFGQTVYTVIQGAIVKWNNFKNSVSNVMNLIRNTIINIWNNIKARIVGFISGIVNGVVSGFNGLVSKVRGALSGIYNAIASPFKKAYNTVKPIIDAIKSGADAIGGAVSWLTGGSGSFESSVGSAGFTTGGSLGNIMNNNASSSTIVNINGIVENNAKDYIVNAVSDRVKKENLITGVI